MTKSRANLPLSFISVVLLAGVGIFAVMAFLFTRSDEYTDENLIQAATLSPVALSQMFNDSKTFTFQYPAGWTADIDTLLDMAYLAKNEQILYGTDMNRTQMQIPSTEVFIRVGVGEYESLEFVYGGNFSSVTDATEALTGSIQRAFKSVNTPLEIERPTYLTLNGRAIGLTRFATSHMQETTLYIHIDDAHYGYVLTSTAPGELHFFEATSLEILQSIRLR